MVPEPCRFCIYWQTSGEFHPEASKIEIERKKLNWLGDVEKAFGENTEIASINGDQIGFMQYAPAKYFPRVMDYASGPPSDQAIFIACLYITSIQHRGKGYGTLMLKHLLNELRIRSFNVVETFARADSENNPSGPLAFYLKNGFEVVRRRDDFPLVGLKL